MNLEELKTSLTRFPPDVHDAHVILVTEDFKTAKLLAFTAVAQVAGQVILVLGSPEAVKHMNFINPPDESK